MATPPAQLSFCKVGELPGKADGELVRVPEAVLHQGPVCHPTVPRHRVEIEVAVQVVPHPLHLVIGVLGSGSISTPPPLPHHVRVLAVGGGAHVVGGAIHPLLKVVDSDTSVVEANDQHVRMVGVDVTGHHLVYILF